MRAVWLPLFGFQFQTCLHKRCHCAISAMPGSVVQSSVGQDKEQGSNLSKSVAASAALNFLLFMPCVHAALGQPDSPAASVITIGLRPRTPGLSYEPPACVPVHVPLTGPSRQANELGADVACLLLSRGMALALALRASLAFCGAAADCLHQIRRPVLIRTAPLPSQIASSAHACSSVGSCSTALAMHLLAAAHSRRHGHNLRNPGTFVRCLAPSHAGLSGPS